MPDYKTLELIRDGGVSRVFLNRPEVRNAFNDLLISELQAVFDELSDDSATRVIVLSGRGTSFCAGADLNWMKSMVDYSFEQNLDDSRKLSKMMHTIFTCPKPVIGKINGTAVGGGVGLVSVCDITVADDIAVFGLSEVKLGLVPAVIAPYVINKIGPAPARELFITGERIKAEHAVRLGLLHYALPKEQMDDKLNSLINIILKNGPHAVSMAKDLVFQVTQKVFPELSELNARLIAEMRIGDEAQEGMSAFLEKRKPNWLKQ